MIVVKLMGGLGNQMFQYACGRAVAEIKGVDLFLDHSFLEDRSFRNDFTYRNYELDIFDIHRRLSDPAIIPTLNYFKEFTFYFNFITLHCTDNTYLEGYFQSEKYFSHINKIIRNDFIFKNTFSSSYKRISDSICSNTNPVAIHVRRGDYLTVCGGNKYPVCPLSYYNNAMRYIAERVENPVFYVFSDDYEWTKNNFIIAPFNPIVIDSRNSLRSSDDMHLMTKCKHHIMANSSFSWWGTWLANHPTQIAIGPELWFGNNYSNTNTFDLFPNHWKRLNSTLKNNPQRISHYLNRS